MTEAPHVERAPYRIKDDLSALMNVGPMMRRDLQLLGINTVAQLAEQEADDLYRRLHAILGRRVDPCVHDVLAATIHQARTGRARPWWHFTPARKQRQAAGTFVRSNR